MQDSAYARDNVSSVLIRFVAENVIYLVSYRLMQLTFAITISDVSDLVARMFSALLLWYYRNQIIG